MTEQFEQMLFVVDGPTAPSIFSPISITSGISASSEMEEMLVNVRLRECECLCVRESV